MHFNDRSYCPLMHIKFAENCKHLLYICIYHQVEAILFRTEHQNSDSRNKSTTSVISSGRFRVLHTSAEKRNNLTCRTESLVWFERLSFSCSEGYALRRCSYSQLRRIWTDSLGRLPRRRRFPKTPRPDRSSGKPSSLSDMADEWSCSGWWSSSRAKEKTVSFRT